jgi:SAM-dependent methyltransferase
VFQAMARYFDEVLAIDQDPDMVAYARETAADFGLGNVLVRQMRAEDVGPDTGPIRMAVFGASFHWMDRPRVGDKLYDLLEWGGYLAVLSSGGIHSGETDWEAAVRGALHRHQGSERRAGSGIYREGERHEQALKRTRFKVVEVTDFPVWEEWSLDRIVGYLNSTSYASRSVLGGRAEAFEADVRTSLIALRPDGVFGKLARYTVILAER